MDKAPEHVEIFDPIDLGLHMTAALTLVGALATGTLVRLPWAVETTVNVAFFHGLFGVLAITAWMLHFARAILMWLEGSSGWPLLLRTSDLGDMLKSILWNFGVGSAVRRDRRTYRERLPYTFFMVCTPLLVAGGFMAARPSYFLGMLGPDGLVTAAMVHTWLGVLCAAALAFHLFFAMLSPGALWFNAAFITGKQAFTRLERMHPDTAALIIAETASAHTEEEEEKVPTVEELLKLGNDAAREGDLKAAAAHYVTALKHYPGYPQALFNLGLTLHKSGDEERAARVLGEYLAQDEFGAAAERARSIIAEIKEREERR